MHSAASGRIRFDELRCTLCVPLSVDIKVNLIMPGSTLRNSVRYQIAAGVMSDAAADGSAPDRLIVSRENPWVRSGESNATFFRLPGGQISTLRPPIFDSRHFSLIEDIVAQIENLSLYAGRQTYPPDGSPDRGSGGLPWTVTRP